jgi:hypothetical protein
MEPEDSSGMLVSIYKTTRRFIPEDSNLDISGYNRDQWRTFVNTVMDTRVL